MNIRSYTLGDQEAVEAFFERAWRATRFPFDPADAHADIRRIPSEYQAMGGGFWLLRVGQRIVGTVAVRRLGEGMAEIKRLIVDPAYRGRGYGDRLMRHAMEHCSVAGFRVARLDTLRSPGPAVRLFERFGFVEIPRYNTNPDAELFMELDLRRPIVPAEPLPER